MATLFISDLHLDAQHPEITRQFLDFLAHQAPSAEALYILGDLFEVWIGDQQFPSVADWEFLYTTGQARQYAGDRFSEHVDRFNDLAAALEGQADDDTLGQLAARYGERDNPFPDIDSRLFASRQP